MIDAVTRPAGDILSRVVRVRLGGQEYVLPVRSIRANREWKAQLDALTAAKIEALSAAGDDLEAILASLAEDIDPMVDLLVSYDRSGQLQRDAILDIEPDASMDVIAACREVWLAATPFVGTVIETLQGMTDPSSNAGSEPTSSPPRSGAGRRKRSKPN